MAANDTTWTDAAVTNLRRLWDEGHATAEIGRRLGVTKNAVVGKAHRLDLPGRPSPIRVSGVDGAREKPKRTTVPKLTELEPARAAQPPSRAPATPASPPAAPPKPAEPQRRAQRPGPSDHCCWPVGEPGRAGFRFCDAPVPRRVIYCDEHAGLAYVRGPSQSSDRASA